MIDVAEIMPLVRAHDGLSATILQQTQARAREVLGGPSCADRGRAAPDSLGGRREVVPFV